jgi:c-di-GMP-binding flagellar brake protein YcgR
LFWKKKKDKDSLDPFHLGFDLDRRNFFRVEPAPGQPVRFQIDENTYDVTNLSAGGMALRGAPVSVGQPLAGRLHLPDIASQIEIKATVVETSHDNEMAALKITSISDEDRELIHQYVLQRQLQELNRKRAEREAADKSSSTKHKQS